MPELGPALDPLPGGPPFAFVPPGHPLRPEVERFWHHASHAPALRGLLGAAGGPSGVRSVLRLAPGRPPRLKWLLVSVQRELEHRFDAVTLLYRARRDRLSVFELPEDPLLPSLPALVPEVGDVLQYVPRHRFTFRRRGRRRGRGVIGKVPRAEELEPTWRRLRAVWDAARRAEAPFAVAEPLGVDRGRGVVYQAELGGVDLARRLGAADLRPLLRQAGCVHAELQSLRVDGLPCRRVDELLPRVREHVELVALMRPGAAAAAAAAAELLLATVPAAGRTAFCHGDLRCGHLLEDGGRWSVIDADGCRQGDPFQDVARLLAFLKRDVPYLRACFAAPGGDAGELDAAEDAFLEGYRERAGVPLDEARLAWYLLAHELHFLARMFKRDLHDPVAFERGVRRLGQLGDRLRERLGGRRRP